MIITNYKPHTKIDARTLRNVRNSMLSIMREGASETLASNIIAIANVTAVRETQREDADAVWTTWLEQARAEVEAIA